MTIDNFNLFESKLDFQTPNDRYIIHILRRPKDVDKNNSLGSNETQRLIRSYYIDSIEYYKKKIEAIKELCITNNARAYIIPQVRDNVECLWNLSFAIQEAIRHGNTSVKPEHMIRSAYCGSHKSRDKKWILDLDNNEMYGWNANQVFEMVKSWLIDCGRNPSDAYTVPTKNGWHIITPPFNLMEAAKKCDMIYEGVRQKIIGVKHTGPGETEEIVKAATGWLHKDGMSLLYYNKED